MSSKDVISVQGLSKMYRIGKKSDPTLRGTLSKMFNSSTKSNDFWALNDVSFTIKQGEAIGIIGKNGAGKSTLLKLLSRITHPTKGKAVLKGRVASLLEVGTGFHPELTGRENIYLNGSLLGMSRDEIKSSLDEIIEFSGVSQFIDTPVKRYSSGMYVRLAFSVAAHLKTDILLVDEVLSVGDYLYKEKSKNKINEIINEGKTVLIVSHNLDLIKKTTTKSLYFDHGRLIDSYKSSELDLRLIKKVNSKVEIPKPKYFEIHSIIINENKPVSFDTNLVIEIILDSFFDLESCSLMIGLENNLGQRVVTILSHEDDVLIYPNAKSLKLKVTFPNNVSLPPGNFDLIIGLISPPYNLIEKVRISNGLIVSEYNDFNKKFPNYLGSIIINPKWEL